MSGTLDEGVRVNPGAESGKHKSPSLVSLTPDAHSKGKDFSLAGTIRNGRAWLGDFLADGAEKVRHGSFEPKDKIQIWLVDGEKEKK